MNEKGNILWHIGELASIDPERALKIVNKEMDKNDFSDDRFTGALIYFQAILAEMIEKGLHKLHWVNRCHRLIDVSISLLNKAETEFDPTSYSVAYSIIRQITNIIGCRRNGSRKKSNGEYYNPAIKTLEQRCVDNKLVERLIGLVQKYCVKN